TAVRASWTMPAAASRTSLEAVLISYAGGVGRRNSSCPHQGSCPQPRWHMVDPTGPVGQAEGKPEETRTNVVEAHNVRIAAGVSCRVERTSPTTGGVETELRHRRQRAGHAAGSVRPRCAGPVRRTVSCATARRTAFARPATRAGGTAARGALRQIG